MTPDGSIHPTTDKSTVIMLLKDLVPNDIIQDYVENGEFEYLSIMCLVVDGMRVVQELMAVKSNITCTDLATSHMALNDSKVRGYCNVIL